MRRLVLRSSRPWQSWTPISMFVPYSLYICPSPCSSREKWQSEQWNCFEVDVAQMHGLLELVRIVGRHDAIVLVEEIALLVALEHGHEVPAVAVIVGELRVLRLRISMR